jgi:RNA polymerase sigma factor (sigma-70 family)
MSVVSFSDFLRRLTRQMGAESLTDQSDCQLVERALAGPDGAAFEAIVRRHGTMVYRVCWRVLQHPQDTEDAFQATFLVLAQKLRTVREPASLASWLHGVAHRVAIKAKRQSAVRRRRESLTPVPEPVPSEDTTWKDLRSALDAELGQLPENWRLPLILCYLEGRTQDEAAVQLGWSKSKLRRHLERGRAALGRRLAGRDITAPASLTAILLSDCLASAAPASGFLAATVEAAAGVLVGKTVATVVTAKVAALTEGMVKAMFVAKLKTVMSVVMLLGVLTVGGLLTQRRVVGHPNDGAKSGVEEKQGAAEGSKQVDSPEPSKADEDKQRGAKKDEKLKPDKELPALPVPEPLPPGPTLAAAPTADRVNLVRQMYAKLPCEILEFVEPLKRFVAAQKDGKSIMLLLEDAKDKKLTIIHLFDSRLSKTPGSLLLTTGHLPPRGPEESAVYGLLLRLAANPPEKTTKLQLKLLDEVLAVLDERFAGAMPIAPKGAEK